MEKIGVRSGYWAVSRWVHLLAAAFECLYLAFSRLQLAVPSFYSRCRLFWF
jgi:hypothetical protein